MKTHILSRMLVMFFLMTGWITAQAQSQMEVPGDNFSLEGALEMFKKSSTPEEFEKLLNNPDTKVNNLDLNGDGYIDYIRVIDRNEGNVHAFILQAVISDRQSQDVAVITLEKLANGKAVLQIIGDEDIYGVETIIEPTREVQTYAGTTSSRFVVNVWAWPFVQYVYSPYYVGWVSPWGWNYRPYWWYSWRPVAYYDYYPYWHAYRPYYSVCYTHRIVYAEHIYRPYRTTSVIVYNRHNTQITHYRSSRSDINSRVRNDAYRSSGRQTNNSVRYDANGRIKSSGDQSVRTRSSSETRTPQNNTIENRSYSRTQSNASSGNRSASDSRTETSSTQQRERTAVPTDRNGSSASSNNQRYERGSSTTPSNGRSYNSGSSATTQRSTASPGVQRSSGSSNVQRSSGSSNVQRSSGSSNVQRSSGSSNVQRSSGSSNVQRSSGSSNVQRSSGSSNVQRSSGSSNVQRSSGSSNVQRSSGSSNVQRSSGSSSSRQSSGSSSEQKRGRQ